jgi:CHAT domain-containing protein
LRDAEAAWDQLSSGKPITPQQSEAFIDVLFAERVLKPGVIPPDEKRVLMNLANALQQNHHDAWLKDFLNAPFSADANHSLELARSYRGSDFNQMLKDARAAESLYRRAGNTAGAALSQLEIIYAERRRSHADECVRETSRLQRRIAQLSYASFHILAARESSNCQTMLGNFDRARQLAEQMDVEADRAHYPSLKLRARALFSTQAWVEGRYQAAFNADADGLELYWKGFFAGIHGFQFYSNSALTAEQAGFWNLAAILWQEALAEIAPEGRGDFEATAHYHRATSLVRAGEPEAAQEEFREAYRLFGKMKDPSFLLANSEVDLAEIEIEQENLSSAQDHLQKASSVLEQANSLVVKLSYYNAMANLERHQNRPDQEWKYLSKTTEIASQGFTHLPSRDARWEWYQEVDRSFHRLIELEIEHDPTQALSDWEAYRAAEVAPSQLAVESRANRDRLVSYLNGLRSSTLVSFIVFPERVVILVADDQGVRPFPSLVNTEALKRESELFLRLCSDKTSSLEKVNQEGSRLYKRLLQPIQKELMPERSLVIEADGFLSRIPWPALVAENGSYLGEEYMIASTPGLFFTAPERGGKKPVEGKLVVYPGAAEFEGKVYKPLPHAREEAEFVAQISPGSKYLREEEATRNELLRQLPRASSFHFAGHGVSREHGGELLLSKETLSASTVRSLDLSGMDLVVLSACSTAEADLDIARSPNGLVQAFLSAGAREVVASRWDVDSGKSLDYMKTFASAFAASNDAKRAIRTARDKVRRDARHPYYWASFDLFGNMN